MSQKEKPSQEVGGRLIRLRRKLADRHQGRCRAAVKLDLKPAFQWLRSQDAASLWLLLAGFLVAQSLLLSLLAEDPNQFISLALAWSGAYLVCRAPMPIASRSMRPILLGASLGSLLLAALPGSALRQFLPSVLILAILSVMQILGYSNAGHHSAD
jgi:hypothetical protein